MKRRTSISVCALLGVMVATLAQGATTFRYNAGIPAVARGNYNDLAALTTDGHGWPAGGTGAGGLPGMGDLMRINVGPPPGILVTLTNVAPNVYQFQIGVDESGQLVVASGGTLTVAGSTSKVGNNGGSGVVGQLIVQTNGVVNSTPVLYVGAAANGYLIIDGGSVNLSNHLWVGGNSGTGQPIVTGTIIITNGGVLNMLGVGGNGMLGLGTYNATAASGSFGILKVCGGGVANLFNISNPGLGSIWPGSVLDISGSGVVTFPGNKTNAIAPYVTAGRITAYGGTGTVAMDYDVSNAGKTTLKAVGGYVPPTDCTWIATSGPGFWNDSTNWSCGYAPVSVTLVTFNVPSAIPCIVKASASADSIDMGTNGPGGTLIVTNTGNLACSGTNANFIGNNSSALMVVESGTTATFGGPLRIGFDAGADGTLLMNGGTVSVAGMFDLGYQGGKGTAQIKGGTLNLAAFDDYASIGAAALLDITGTGTVVLNGDHSLAMNYYSSIAGQITNSSGAGLLVDYNIIHSGKTTVYPANLPLAPEQIVWNPALLNASDPNGLWNVSSNWYMPMCPGNATVVYFNIAGAIPCIVTNAAVAGYVDMGTLAGPGGTLIVTNGGSLTTYANNWTAVGYDNTALFMVEAGSSATLAGHLWVGFNAVADGTVIVDGGTVSVGQMFGLGWNGGKGTCIVTNGGRLNLAQLHPTDSIKGSSVLSLADMGTVLITGNYVSAISNYVANGKITANGGAGTVAYGFDPVANQTAIQVAPSRQSVTGVTASSGNTTLTCQTTAGHIYHIESTPSLSPAVWTRVAGTTTNATGASVTFSLPAGSGQMFYRTVSP